MTVYEQIKNMDLDELAVWIRDNWLRDNDLVLDWWDKMYCQKCEPEKITFPNIDHEYEVCWCEKHGKCRYFKEFTEVPEDLQKVKLWLQSQINYVIDGIITICYRYSYSPITESSI